MSALIARQVQPSLAERLADVAVQALIDEADLSPKPGLVDRRGNGSHDDLHLGLMHASANALWPTFKAMAGAALIAGEVSQSLREALGQLGRDGEVAMLRVTGGVNTHRGAIWALGLLCAAAALHAGSAAPRHIAATAAALARLDDPGAPANPDSHGARACRTYGVLGAREQAQHGFPAVIEQGLPQLVASRRDGEQNAQLDALLAIMSQLTDTCVLHRAGLEGLTRMQAGACAVLAAGGAGSLAGRRQLLELDRDMLTLRASPGGAADLLAATLFLDRLAPAASAPIGSN